MAIEPPRTSQPAADAMQAGEPTVALPTTHASARRSGGFSLWPRTLRWRLILTFATLLGLTLVLLGVALNVLIARALYTTEFGFFQNESLAAVSASQSRFDTLTLGRNATCSDALPYETAFQQAIADPITVSHPGSIQGVYLLDGAGNVLAPLSAQAHPATQDRAESAARQGL